VTLRPGSNKRIITRRNTTIVSLVLAFVLVVGVGLWVIRLNNRIARERELETASSRVEVEQKKLTVPATDGLTVYLNSADVRAVATFADAQYLATSGGLLWLDENGNVKRRYTTLDGLPDNDLTALAVFRDRLFIGTASAGLIGFDGNEFTGFSFKTPKATRVSVLVATDSELLIGTLDGGVFEYDGERFTRRVSTAAGSDLNRVTALLPFESRLYIGTHDRGLYIWREAHIEQVTTSNGLPSPHVTALVAMPSSLSQAGAIGVATDFAVVAVNDANEIKPMTNRANITSLAVSGGRLWAGLFGGGVIDLVADRAARPDGLPETRSILSETPGLPRQVPTIVCASEGRLWALTQEGAFVRDERAAGPAFEAVAASLAGERVLTTGYITSLAVDGAGRLWVGYFDRGIDLIATETFERVSHIEDDRIREVNFIAFDPGEDRMLAATSRGLVSFDGRMKQSILTREQGGLINDSVAHVSVADVSASIPGSPEGATPARLDRDRALVVATAGGLTQLTGGRARSLTAFHGLASNHLYTSATVGSRLFVGSLAGLVELEGLRVVRSYKTSNSRLSHDWITALAESGGTLYIGTNGGGVDALLPTGEWVNFSDEIGKLEVNQNAMHFDGERLFVGTSDRGLLVYNTRDRRWTGISAGLASQSVTAITSDDSFVYAGTSNGLVRIEKRVLG
jgi:ligand-binding sensor domain-containing protein